MRASHLPAQALHGLVVVSALLSAARCVPSFGRRCATDEDCDADFVCADQLCVPRAPEGEGEGDGEGTQEPSQLRSHLALGQRHGVYITDDARLVAWGADEVGQLGDGDEDHTGRIVFVDTSAFGDARPQQVVAGMNHTLVLLDDGRVFAWGDNRRAQTGRDVSVDVVNAPREVLLVAPALEVAAGRLNGYARLDDGRVFAWGDNVDGQAGTNDNPSATLQEAHCTGSVLEGHAGELVPTPKLVPIQAPGGEPQRAAAIWAGPCNLFVRDENGAMWGAGSNATSQLDNVVKDDQNIERLTPLDAGEHKQIGPADFAVGLGMVAALDETGLATWGNNEQGKLAHGHMLLTNPWWEHVAWNFPEPLQPTAMVVLGRDTTYALTADGNVYGAGSAADGALGALGSSTSKLTLFLSASVFAPERVVAIAANYTTAALVLDLVDEAGRHSLRALGYNNDNALGTCAPGETCAATLHTPTLVQLPVP